MPRVATEPPYCGSLEGVRRTPVRVRACTFSLFQQDFSATKSMQMLGCMRSVHGRVVNTELYGLFRTCANAVARLLWICGTCPRYPNVVLVSGVVLCLSIVKRGVCTYPC